MRTIISRIFAVSAAACLCLFTTVHADESAAASAKEAQVKIAFLFNFIKFTQWPDLRSPTVSHKANMCILGDNPFGDMLHLLEHASSPEFTLEVNVNVRPAFIPQCHVLFVAAADPEELHSILAIAKKNAVLTVSELPGFARDGGIVEMVKVEQSVGLFSKNKINLRINLRGAEEEGLHLDAQMLEIAAEVLK